MAACKSKMNLEKEVEMLKKEIENLQTEVEKLNGDITRLVHAQSEQLDLIMEDVSKVLNIVFKES
tara:strand:- start:377 stop:571 length:195 start_codon:yes stop_codon:yes gene_type:complete